MFFSIRTAPYEISFAFVLSVWVHGKADITERSSVSVNVYRIRDSFRASTSAVKVNKGTYTAILEETVGGHVIHSRIKAHILYGECRHMLLHFAKGSKKTYRVMPLSAGKAQEERDIRVKGAVMAGQLKERKVLIQITVPSPCGIRVRIMAGSGSKFL